MDPTEVYARFDELAEEFYESRRDDRAAEQDERLPATGAGADGGTREPDLHGHRTCEPAITATQAVILTSRAWGHEGGNELTAEFVHPGVAGRRSPWRSTGPTCGSASRRRSGRAHEHGRPGGAAINANAGAFAKLIAQTYRGNAGGGIVQPRTKGNLSDFLTTATNANVARGPFEYKVMRIRTKAGNNERVGVFLYCQQHAREWATPLTCLETAEQLLRNYGTDKTTREAARPLDIFILPSSNPDGAHYSMHNFNSQRKNMTNWCMFGGLETDDPTAANFWTGKARPDHGDAVRVQRLGGAQRPGART